MRDAVGCLSSDDRGEDPVVDVELDVKLARRSILLGDPMLVRLRKSGVGDACVRGEVSGVTSVCSLAATSTGLAVRRSIGERSSSLSRVGDGDSSSANFRVTGETSTGLDARCSIAERSFDSSRVGVGDCSSRIGVGDCSSRTGVGDCSRCARVGGSSSVKFRVTGATRASSEAIATTGAAELLSATTGALAMGSGLGSLNRSGDSNPRLVRVGATLLSALSVEAERVLEAIDSSRASSLMVVIGLGSVAAALRSAGASVDK